MRIRRETIGTHAFQERSTHLPIGVGYKTKTLQSNPNGLNGIIKSVAVLRIAALDAVTGP
jgi:hypothetical protein